MNPNDSVFPRELIHEFQLENPETNSEESLRTNPNKRIPKRIPKVKPNTNSLYNPTTNSKRNLIKNPITKDPKSKNEPKRESQMMSNPIVFVCLGTRICTICPG